MTTRVACYRNLNRRCWSITTVRGITGRGSLMIHLPSVTLANVDLKVQTGGRRRVLREERKNVHAWAVGEIIDEAPAGLPETPIRYNPYQHATFVRRDTGEPVTHCDYVRFDESGLATALGHIN